MTPLRTVIICQARTGSSRLPSKVLLPLAGAPLLVRFMQRVQRSTLADAVVVATTIDHADDPLVALCEANNYPFFRGHPVDLVDRHLQCAEAFNADVVVKIPSDCPLIDPLVIDTVISEFMLHHDHVDYVSNLHPPTFPDGNDVEVMSIDTLRRCASQAHAPFQREHTTPWMWDANPDVRCRNVVMNSGEDLSMSHRWTIDYAEDYVFIKSVYDMLYAHNPSFTMQDVLDLVDEHPEIAMINRHLAGVNWYRHHLAELRTIHPSHTRTP